jgi:hypothetical protein
MQICAMIVTSRYLTHEVTDIAAEAGPSIITTGVVRFGNITGCQEVQETGEM